MKPTFNSLISTFITLSDIFQNYPIFNSVNTANQNLIRKITKYLLSIACYWVAYQCTTMTYERKVMLNLRLNESSF